MKALFVRRGISAEANELEPAAPTGCKALGMHQELTQVSLHLSFHAETITELLKEQQEILAEQRPDKPPAARSVVCSTPILLSSGVQHAPFMLSFCRSSIHPAYLDAISHARSIALLLLRWTELVLTGAEELQDCQSPALTGASAGLWHTVTARERMSHFN